jgi:LL-diaminopimelate aminotransferase
VTIEFHSLSKTFNMTGWRIGFAVGNAELIAGLRKVKTNIDSGTFQAVQEAGIAALSSPPELTEGIRKIYRERRDILARSLKQAGLDFELPAATFYLWARVPSGQDSAGYTTLLLEKNGVAVTPGVGFGKTGEGYIRFALTKDKDRIAEAARRIASL